ncbi:MAG: O-antigen ligase family protein [Patescibacteria group bacterium]
MALDLRKALTGFWLTPLAGFIILEAASLAAYPSIWLSRIFFIAALAIAAVLTSRKIEYGIYLLVGELIVGGFGYLLFFPMAGGRVSLRLGLFAVIGSVWLIKQLKTKDFKWLNDRRLWLLLLFFIAAAIAAGRGFFNGYPASAIFSDFNNYLYFALIGLFAASQPRLERLTPILLIGSLILGLKTIATLFLFSHGLAGVGSSLIYHWIRNTGVGEITLISAPLYRIFFQSQLYNLLALIFGAFILLIRASGQGQIDRLTGIINQSWRWRLILWLSIWLNFLTVVISQSRSFWVAGLAALVILLPIAAIYFKVNWQRLIICLLLIPGFAITANLAGQAIIGDFQTDFFTGRVGGASGSVGISSRMAELEPAWTLIKQKPLFGQGFGATIRFRSDDPRIKNQANPEGWIDAPALEWGYLDLAVKAGLIGLILYLIFLGSLVWELLLRAKEKNLLAASLLIGLLTLMIIHIFTPYLNHPLGLGYILMIFALIKNPRFESGGAD